MDTSKKMWSFPWQYRESLVVAGALVLGGFGLQWAAGPLNLYFLHEPVNYFLGGLIVAAALIGGLALKKNRVVQWLGGAPWAVTLILTLLLFSLAMGLTPQTRTPHPETGLWARLGFAQVTSSWPFVLIYLVTLFSLALAVARRLRRPRKNLVFLLNHAGLWLVLAAAGLGAADRVRYVMHVEEGQVEWRVYAPTGQMLELPLAIRLVDFEMEEYPPKLAVIDRASGLAQPEGGKPDLYQVDPDQPQGRLLDWEVTLLNYLYQAVPAGEGRYQAAPMPAAAQAVEVAARHRLTGETRQGWVTAGNRFLAPAPLVLDERLALVMAQPEPKRFLSKIKVFSQDGVEKEAELEVNHPLRVGHWLIYQYGYDNQAGRMSTYSSFELVYDPWLPMVYFGLALWALGALGLIYQGRQGRKSLKEEMAK